MRQGLNGMMSIGQWLSNPTWVRVWRQRLIMITLIALGWNLALPALASATYVDNGDGTVTDTTTSLIWKHCGEGQTWSGITCSGQLSAYTWAAATALTNTVTFAGQSDWRLPTLTELQTIVKATTYQPTISSIDATVFPNQNYIFWSNNVDTTTPSNAMYVSFIYGNSASIDKTNALAAHLVRGSISAATTTTTSTTTTTTNNSGTTTTTTLAPPISFTQALAQGWNLIGNSLDKTIPIATLYSDQALVETIWKWDAASSTWQFYTPALTAEELLAYTQSKSYGLLTELKAGEGYWVNAKKTAALAAQTGQPFSLGPDDLITGWNLVSTADDLSPADFNTKLSTSPPGLDGIPSTFTTLWTWNGSLGKWYFYAPSLAAQGGTVLADYIAAKGYLDFTVDKIKLGKGVGFWVNKTQGNVVIPTPTLTLSLVDEVGAAVTSISNSSPAHVTAKVLDANGVEVAGTIVSFSTDPLFGAFSGGANTALTNASGLASATLTTSNTSGGASTVTASATVDGIGVTASLNYAIGSSVLSLSPLTFSPVPPLSAYGTASVSVNVLNNGDPYTTPIAVSFTSACAASGKAKITSTVTTVNGTATASYLDNGCNNSAPGDAITATLLTGVSVTGTLPVSSPAIGSLQFVSVATNPPSTPTMITLKGTGGTNMSESAQVTFRVVDSAGNPVGNIPVAFTLNTGLGGLQLTSATATSDPSTGNVVTYVQAGTMSTSVRVTAKTGTLSTQSDLLYVSTGIPAQDSISMSASKFNIEGWNFDGETTDLTVMLADHFHNPVLDGTAVYFTSEGGSVASACTTVANKCTATLTSQALRPTNGRVTVLARVTGEEAFTDLNSNGTADAGELIDANGYSTDIGEAYADYNEDGIRDPAKEPYIDFNGSEDYDGTALGGWPGDTSTGDGEYNGLLCTDGDPICSGQKSIDVRDSFVIVFSTSYADIVINDGNDLVLPSCVDGLGKGGPVKFMVSVVDQHGNAMPVGTTVGFSADNGTITSPAQYVVPNTQGCRSGAGYADCPGWAGLPTFGNIPVTVKEDASYNSTTKVCTNDQASGTLTVTVTTPKGVITTDSISVSD